MAVAILALYRTVAFTYQCLLKWSQALVRWCIQKVGKWFSSLLLTINKGVGHGGVGMRTFTPWLGVPNPVLISVPVI